MHRSLSKTSSLVLFVPCISLSFSWLDCGSLPIAPDQCFTQLHLFGTMFVALVLPIFVILALATQSVLISRTMKNCQLSSRTDGRGEVRLLLLKLSLMMAYTFKDSSPGFQLLKYVLLVFTATAWISTYLFVQLYVDPRMNEVQAGFAGIFCFSVLNTLLSFLAQHFYLVLISTILAPAALSAGLTAVRLHRLNVGSCKLQSLTSDTSMLLWVRSRIHAFSSLSSNQANNLDEDEEQAQRPSLMMAV